MPVFLLVFFTIVISIPIGLIINYLVYGASENSNSKWFAVVGLVALSYILLIIMDFDLDRFGEGFQNRIRGDKSSDNIVIFCWIASIISSIFIFKKIKK